MPNFLRLLLLAATILSLQTARWAYVRGQARQERAATAQLVLAAAPKAGLQWLPYASWQSWPVPAAYRARQEVTTSTVSSTL